jgi:hypothetical protein
MLLLFLAGIAAAAQGCSATRIEANSTALTVEGCVFEGLNGQGVSRGGAISVAWVPGAVTITKSTFVSCAVYCPVETCSIPDGPHSYGGACCLEVQSDVRVTFCCGRECSSATFGQFLFLNATVQPRGAAAADLEQNSVLLCGGTASQAAGFSYAGHDGNFSYFNFSRCHTSPGTVGFDVLCFENNTFNRFVVWNCSGGWGAFFFGGACYLNYFSLYQNTAAYSLLRLDGTGLLQVSYSNIDHAGTGIVNVASGLVEFMNCYFSGPFPYTMINLIVHVDCFSSSSTNVVAHGTDTLKCPVTETQSPMASPTPFHSTRPFSPTLSFTCGLSYLRPKGRFWIIYDFVFLTVMLDPRHS